MDKPKIVFLCHFSNAIIRERLDLNNYKFRNVLKGHRQQLYDDFAIWVSDYIAEFEKHPDVEFHIIAPHYGLKSEIQSFELNGIRYHFFKSNNGIIHTVLEKTFHNEEKEYYPSNRKKISTIIKNVNPDLIILCGAENPYYSLGALDVTDKPVYVILQTLLNDPKRVEMGVGNAYRRKVETAIFKHAVYFCTSGEKEIDRIKECNTDAVILSAGFPTHRPQVVLPIEKEYDYVFFARSVTKNKGIEDLIHALSLVVKKNDALRLNIIGAVENGYKKNLAGLIAELGIANNVHFSGYFQQVADTYKNVAKAKVVVVPGITAGLNSTVREAMLMGLPTICYETTATKQINDDNICLLTAPMEDIETLANQMLFAITCSEQAREISENGKAYAELHFSNEAIVNKLLDNCRIILNKENNEKDSIK